MASSSSSAAPPRPPWVILSRTARVRHDAVEDLLGLSLSLELADTPYIHRFTVPGNAHLYPTKEYSKPHGADKYALVITANDSGVLLHMSRDTSVGFDLDKSPSGVLVVASGFLPAGAPSTVTRLPRRVRGLQHPVSSVRSVGLLPVPGTGGAQYVVAELRVVTIFCSLSTFRSGSHFWEEQLLICPLVWGEWTPHDVIAHNGKLWWVDLTQGLLGCNLLSHTPELRYVELPEIFGVKGDKPPDGIKWQRFVGVSDGRLRFVDISLEFQKPPEEALVVIWTLVTEPFSEDELSGKKRWELHTTTTMALIWASDSYKATQLQKKIPLLEFLHPHNPDVVYFFLTGYLFAVDVRNSKVVNGRVRDTRQPPLSWRPCFPWVLPPAALASTNGIYAS